jgi:hypothetical protein
MIKSKKELILESFQKMDSNMLDLVLDDSKTYQDANKEVFIEKLIEAFNKFKEGGDTCLIPYKGICTFTDCTNKGCKGYSFVGNSTKNHLDLIFEETDDNYNDIYHCNRFETNDKSIERDILLDIKISIDEKADFKPSIEFLTNSQKLKLAYEELHQYKDITIDKTIYIPWLEKHDGLYKSLSSLTCSSSALDKFNELYQGITELNNYLQNNDLAVESLIEFEKINKSDERYLLIWLTKNENLGNDITLLFFYEIDLEYSANSGNFNFQFLKINILDFVNLNKFKFLFDKYYWDMLEKYTTFSSDVIDRYRKENNELVEYISSLTYHLYKREIIE